MTVISENVNAGKSRTASLWSEGARGCHFLIAVAVILWAAVFSHLFNRLNDPPAVAGCEFPPWDCQREELWKIRSIKSFKFELEAFQWKK